MLMRDASNNASNNARNNARNNASSVVLASNNARNNANTVVLHASYNASSVVLRLNMRLMRDDNAVPLRLDNAPLRLLSVRLSVRLSLR